MIVVDLGAGRGSFLEDDCGYRRELATLKGKVAKVIGIDVDPAVMTNPAMNEAHVYDGGALPLADGSVDLINSDWTLEHIDDPAGFAAEVYRVLKPGGWFCARTPYLYSLLTLASTIVPNKKHTSVLKEVQPDRLEHDVFPTRYRLNSRGAVRRAFGPDGSMMRPTRRRRSPGITSKTPWFMRR